MGLPTDLELFDGGYLLEPLISYLTAPGLNNHGFKNMLTHILNPKCKCKDITLLFLNDNMHLSKLIKRHLQYLIKRVYPKYTVDCFEKLYRRREGV